MSDPLIIPCAHCAGLNRIPADRLAEGPRCGRCKSSVLTDSPFDVNQASFANQIKGDLPLLVDVWASWCGPCRSFAPTFAQAAAQLKGRCRLAKLDSEANPVIRAIRPRSAASASRGPRHPQEGFRVWSPLRRSAVGGWE